MTTPLKSEELTSGFQTSSKCQMWCSKKNNKKTIWILTMNQWDATDFCLDKKEKTPEFRVVNI